MSKKLSSEEVLAKIGAPDFRSINKTQLIEFVSAIPEMDRETAIKCIEQFPNFTEYATGIVKELYGLLGKATEQNKDIQKDAIASHKRIIDDLSWLLKKEDISEESRTFIIETMCDEANKIDDIAKEHQSFIRQIVQIAASAGGAAVAVAGAILGVRFLGKRN